MLCYLPTLALESTRSSAGQFAAARAPELGIFSLWDSGLGTARGFAEDPDVRAASGWLSAWHPFQFLAGRLKLLGTVLHSSFRTMARAASGWLSALPSDIFSCDAAADPVRVPAFHFSAAEAPEHYHLPVFPQEVIEWMEPGQDKFIIDGTLGGGGHSELFLQGGARVLGVDRDPEALQHAGQRLAAHGSRFSTWEGNFSDLLENPEIQSGVRADGLLLDLGVSSRQLDSAQRGFSFMREGPLDMRMGPSSPQTAADVVNGWDEADLVRILFEYGEEKRARRIASAIIRQRAQKPFVTTLELAACIEAAVGRQGRTHPATRAFQAIRMAVNEELESLAKALDAVPSVLKPGGRLLIITFHSLEDRMVKRFLRHRSTPFIDDPGWPEPRPNPDYQFRLLARKAIAPTPEEIASNPRARSAKLRVGCLLELKP